MSKKDCKIEMYPMKDNPAKVFATIVKMLRNVMFFFKKFLSSKCPDGWKLEGLQPWQPRWIHFDKKQNFSGSLSGKLKRIFYPKATSSKENFLWTPGKQFSEPGKKFSEKKPKTLQSVSGIGKKWWALPKKNVFLEKTPMDTYDAVLTAPL